MAVAVVIAAAEVVEEGAEYVWVAVEAEGGAFASGAAAVVLKSAPGHRQVVGKFMPRRQAHKFILRVWEAKQPYTPQELADKRAFTRLALTLACIPQELLGARTCRE